MDGNGFRGTHRADRGLTGPTGGLTGAYRSKLWYLNRILEDLDAV